jgi:hypothetical protein
MLNDLMLLASGLAMLALTFFGFWVAMPRAEGPPRAFIGGTAEPLLAVAITAGIVLGIGLVVAGVVDILVPN